MNLIDAFSPFAVTAGAPTKCQQPWFGYIKDICSSNVNLVTSPPTISIVALR
jgi:hypothetical protein